MKWFRHETDAHMNLKLQSVIEDLGLEAFGYYWACIELVGFQGENFRIKSEKNWKIYFKKMLGIELDKQNSFLTYFATIELIDKKAFKNGDLYVPKLEERLDDYTNRVRRKFEHGSDNVPLQDNTVQDNTKQDTPSQVAKAFFENPDNKTKHSEFISYWTEPSKSGKKQRWELERTFDVNRRLATWQRNQDKWNKPKYEKPDYSQRPELKNWTTERIQSEKDEKMRIEAQKKIDLLKQQKPIKTI